MKTGATVANIPKEYQKHFVQTKYQGFEFETGFKRSPIDDSRLEQEEIIRPNNIFPLIACLPEGNDVRDVVVFLNGLDETGASIRLYASESEQHPGLSDRLARLSGPMASVLLPLPFHYWRKPTEGRYPFLGNSHLIFFKRKRLYLAFHQTLHDVRALIQLIREGGTPFRQYTGNGKILVHLIGYSLGGLGALSAFLLDRFEQKHEIQSCTLLMSGAYLKDFSLEATALCKDLGPEEAQTALGQILDYHYEGNGGLWEYLKQNPVDRKNPQMELLVKQIFHFVVLGPVAKAPDDVKDVDKLENVLRKASCDVRIVASKQDVVCPYGAVQSAISSRSSGTIGLEIDGGHVLSGSRPWLSEGASKFVNWFTSEVGRHNSQ